MKRNYTKIEFIKDYEGIKKGDVLEFKSSLAHYIIKDGYAKVFKEVKKTTTKKKVIE